MKVGTCERSHPAPLSIPLPRLHVLRLVGLISSVILQALKLASFSDLYLIGMCDTKILSQGFSGWRGSKSVMELWTGVASSEERSGREIYAFWWKGQSNWGGLQSQCGWATF